MILPTQRGRWLSLLSFLVASLFGEAGIEEKVVRQEVGFCSLVKWAVVLALTFPVFAQSYSSPSTISPHDLVQAVITNELKPQAGPINWMYEVDKEQDGQRQTKEVVETSRGWLEKLLSVDGHPLSPAKQEEEAKRIKDLSGNPRELQKHEQVRHKEAEESEAFMKMIPAAFVFSYAGREGQFVKIEYKPNPGYQPPSREARVLHAMAGEILLQADQKRLAGLSGHLQEEVKFGGGLLGYLEKGGSFSVKRAEINPGEWALTAMEVNMNGKVLFLKTISVRQREYHSNFRKLPENLTLADAGELLIGNAVLASNHRQ